MEMTDEAWEKLSTMAERAGDPGTGVLVGVMPAHAHDAGCELGCPAEESDARDSICGLVRQSSPERVCTLPPNHDGDHVCMLSMRVDSRGRLRAVVDAETRADRAGYVRGLREAAGMLTAHLRSHATTPDVYVAFTSVSARFSALADTAEKGERK